jgi:hypothetical protein
VCLARIKAGFDSQHKRKEGGKEGRKEGRTQNIIKQQQNIMRESKQKTP